jgi:hypothetical protein
VLGSSNLTRAYGPQLEEAVRATNSGMADFVDTASLHVCSQCQWWLKARSEGKGHCGLYQRRMNNQRGAVLRGSQRACRQWLSDLREDGPGAGRS